MFAYVDTGIADGAQVDANGNLYAGCGDGAQVSTAAPRIPPPRRPADAPRARCGTRRGR